ncbi:hypothetical protein PCASD_18779 [Puccinia coronata f. sp. avenae]|uniref:Uncharacterized protein n=1 Tax=Puccinia coronata f. sp. avenae TaxID=200324 RepID=A0A2N5T6U8_9BASI|nr:hypothetical protein PCASD_18779 [Puccinia coronata f. sp. avenae]
MTASPQGTSIGPYRSAERTGGNPATISGLPMTSTLVRSRGHQAASKSLATPGGLERPRGVFQFFRIVPPCTSPAILLVAAGQGDFLSSQVTKVYTLQTSQVTKVDTLQTRQVTKVYTLQTRQVTKVYTLQTRQVTKVYTLQTSQVTKVCTVQTSQVTKLYTLQNSQVTKVYTSQTNL